MKRSAADIGRRSWLLPRNHTLLRSWLTRLLVLLLGQFTIAICGCITLCFLHLSLLLTELDLLVRCAGLARKHLLKLSAMFAYSVGQGMRHSLSAWRCSSFKLS